MYETIQTAFSSSQAPGSGDDPDRLINIQPLRTVMENNQIELPDLITKMPASGELSCRLFLEKTGNAYRLVSMIADGVNQGPVPESAVYNYDSTVFVTGVTSSDRLCTWLEDGKGELEGVVFMISPLEQKIGQTRLPSHFRLSSVYDIPLPHSRFTINEAVRSERPISDSRPLVSQGAPSFPDLISAAYALLYGKTRLPGQELIHDIVIRIPDATAWIDRLQLSANSLNVMVRGKWAEGVRFEIRGDNNLYFEHMLLAEGVYTFPLPYGMPARLWLMLSMGDRWLDYRNLDFSGRAPSSWDNISFESESRVEYIAGLASRGESDTIEYKEQIPAKDIGFLNTVAAFANGEGGALLIGVADNPVEVKGITEDIDELTRRVTNLIRDRVSPEPEVKIENCEINDKQVMAIFVDPGKSPPYGVGPKKLVYYVRRNASTFPATQAEVCALVRKFDQHSDSGYMRY